MSVHDLRAKCIPLFGCNSLKDCKALLKIYADFLLTVIQKHQLDKVDSVANAQAKIILQMILTKVLHLKSNIEGINYTSKNRISIKGIIDPTIIAVLIRNAYETVGMFNLIYRTTQTPDEKLILYNLWVYSGLSYRQKFTPVIILEEIKQKAEEEKQILDNLVKEIISTKLYSSLCEKEQNKILQKLKEKDYLIKFENDKVVFIHWHQLAALMGIQDGLLDQIYTYFSLYAHPSNVSVFQFSDMFEKEDPTFEFLTTFNLKNLFIFISSFIADYIYLFPNVLKTFNELPLVNQIVINFHNKFARGDQYSINDTWQLID